MKWMTGIVVFLAIVLFPACSGMQMKRCPEKFQDSDVMQCDDSVQGIYRECQKPKNLYRCTDPL